MSSSLNLQLSALGQRLTASQRLAAHSALTRIKLQEKVREIRLWGKINGLSADYFIAVATNIDTSISKSFYWSNDECATFSQLPAPDGWVSAKAPKLRGMFSGNPAKKYKDPDAPPRINEDGEEEEEDEEEEEEEEEELPAEDEVDEDGNPIVRAPPPRRLTELERLSYNVREIENETCIVPRGLYYLTATGSIQRNPNFGGLSVDESRAFDNFLLLRDAIHPDTLASIRKMGVANHHDFLDRIVPKNSKAKGTWSLHVSDSGLSVSIRSLVYSGFEYQLESGSSDQFGGAYFGLGEKNQDIMFMV